MNKNENKGNEICDIDVSKEQCAPGKDFKEGSCFDLDNLRIIAKEFNKSNEKMKEYNINKIQDKSKKELLRNLVSSIKKVYGCNTQQCWLDQDFIKNLENDEISFLTFRPDGPIKKEWLSTDDINKVMVQYQQKYSDFDFLGTVPSDFENLPQLEISNYSFEEGHSNGINQIGLVINTDPSNKSGQHWFSLYINLKENQIYYFDSFGSKPMKIVKKFMNKVLTFLLKKNKIQDNYNIDDLLDENNLDNFDIRYNKKQFQFKNTECGVYSMNFLIRLLNGESFDAIINTNKEKVKDLKMNKCRTIYFNVNDKK